MKLIMNLINRFGLQSGQEINWKKYSIFFSPNICDFMRRAISRKNGIPIVEDLGYYLGAPIVHNRVRASAYRWLLEKIHNCGKLSAYH
ncbi:hypothetical protein vseg_019761 [Gypsophila vaccaria]